MRRWSSSSDDPFNLSRFTEKHKVYFEQAHAELKRGHKSSCWSWYILPTPPFMKNGQEVGSGQNRTYAIRTDEEARAFLSFRHPTVDLRGNYLAIVQVAAEKLRAGVSPTRLMGIDVPRLQASVAYFERVSREHDPELNTACSEAIDALQMDAQQRSIRAAPRAAANGGDWWLPQKTTSGGEVWSGSDGAVAADGGAAAAGTAAAEGTRASQGGGREIALEQPSSSHNASKRPRGENV